MGAGAPPGFGGMGQQAMPNDYFQQQQAALAQQGYHPQSDINQLQAVQKLKSKRSIMKLFKDYLEAHRDTIFTLILILLADHYVFKGAFADTIKAAFSKILDQAHKKIDQKIEAKL